MVTEALRGYPRDFDAWWVDQDKLDDLLQFLDFMCVGEAALIVLCMNSRHLSAMLLFGILTRSSSFLIQLQCVQWERVLRGEDCYNIAIPLEWAATSRLMRRWESMDAEADLPSIREPILRSQTIFQAALRFEDAFPWFPKPFSWGTELGDMMLVLMGGGAAHMVHYQGFGDLGFVVCRKNSNGHRLHGQQLHITRRLISDAIRNLRSGACHSLLLHGNCRRGRSSESRRMLTLLLEYPVGPPRCVQFCLHVYNSLSELIMSSDLDAAQVAYSGDDTLASSQGLYFSPLPFVAYASGFITVRSKRKSPRGRWLIISTMNRIRRYMLRGFGFRANGAWDDIQDGFYEILLGDQAIPRTTDLGFNHSDARPVMEEWLESTRNAFVGGVDLRMEDFVICSRKDKNEFLDDESYRCVLGLFPSRSTVLYACDMRTHLSHLVLWNPRRTRQFFGKDDKASLPPGFFQRALKQ